MIWSLQLRCNVSSEALPTFSNVSDAGKSSFSALVINKVKCQGLNILATNAQEQPLFGSAASLASDVQLRSDTSIHPIKSLS